METIASATYRGRLGAYAVTVEAAPGATPELEAAGFTVPAALDLLAAPACPHGSMTPDYGGGYLALEILLQLSDPSGIVRAARDLSPRERDVMVHVSGPDGRGGTAYYSGSVTRVTPGRSLSPRVFAGGEVEVEARCRLAAMEDREGRVTAGVRLSDLIHRTATADGLEGFETLTALDLYPVDPAVTLGEEARYTRFTGKIAGSDRASDNGKAAETMLALTRTFGLSVFHPVSRPALFIGGPAAGEDRLLAVPRSRMGTPREVVGSRLGGTFSGVYNLPAASYQPGAGDWRAEPRGNDELPALSQIVFEPTPDAKGAAVAASEIVGVNVPAGSVATERAFGVTPSEGIYLDVLGQFTDRSPASPAFVGSVQVFVVDGEGDEHHWNGSGWTGTPQNYGPDASGVVSIDIPLDNVTPGLLYFRLVGDTQGGNAARLDALRAYVLYTADDTDVLDFVVTFRDPSWGAVPVTLPAMPIAQAYTGTAWENLREWASEITGGTYDLLTEATAAERVATQGRRLRFVTVTLEGVILGPETRVILPGRATDPASPLPADTAFVAVGTVPDFREGATRVALVEAAEDGLAPAPLQPSPVTESAS